MGKTDLEKLAALQSLSAGGFDAFLFDCDGTLADNMMAHKLAYREAAANYGVDLDMEMVDEFAGIPTVYFAREINRRYNVKLPMTFAQEKSDIFISKYIEQTLPIPFVVDHLKNNVGKIKIGVVSGGSRRTVTKTLTVLGLIDFIDVLVCAGETELGKPSPMPFLKAAELLGVEPSKCMVYEDAEFGEQAAQAAGMGCIRVDKI